MIRTQVQFSEEQAKALRAIAHAEGRSVAEIVRDSVADYLAHRRPAAQRAQLEQRARALFGTYHSGRPDVAEDHDRHIAEAFAE